jgi:hypothetical protein
MGDTFIEHIEARRTLTMLHKGLWWAGITFSLAALFTLFMTWLLQGLGGKITAVPWFLLTVVLTLLAVGSTVICLAVKSDLEWREKQWHERQLAWERDDNDDDD